MKLVLDSLKDVFLIFYHFFGIVYEMLYQMVLSLIMPSEEFEQLQYSKFVSEKLNLKNER